jgi:hypothetical protein
MKLIKLLQPIFRQPINATLILSFADTPKVADFKYVGIAIPVATA